MSLDPVNFYLGGVAAGYLLLAAEGDTPRDALTKGALWFLAAPIALFNLVSDVILAVRRRRLARAIARHHRGTE